MLKVLYELLQVPHYVVEFHSYLYYIAVVTVAGAVVGADDVGAVAVAGVETADCAGGGCCCSTASSWIR